MDWFLIISGVAAALFGLLRTLAPDRAYMLVWENAMKRKPATMNAQIVIFGIFMLLIGIGGIFLGTTRS